MDTCRNGREQRNETNCWYGSAGKTTNRQQTKRQIGGSRPNGRARTPDHPEDILEVGSLDRRAHLVGKSEEKKKMWGVKVLPLQGAWVIEANPAIIRAS